MWLQAILTADDLHKALGEVTPTRIPLDKSDPTRSLWIEKPSELSLRPDEGVCISTQARLQWDVIGIKVPVTLRTITIVLTPSIERVDDQEALSFALRVEQADLTAVPAFVEQPIIARVNDALARPDARIVWRFLQTLDFSFLLPELVQPLRRMRLFARWGAVRVGDEGLTLAVGWGLTANAASQRPQADAAASEPEANGEPRTAPPATSPEPPSASAGDESERPSLDPASP